MSPHGSMETRAIKTDAKAGERYDIIEDEIITNTIQKKFPFSSNLKNHCDETRAEMN